MQGCFCAVRLFTVVLNHFYLTSYYILCYLISNMFCTDTQSRLTVLERQGNKFVFAITLKTFGFENFSLIS